METNQEEYDATVETNTELIKDGEAMQRLLKNKDFKRIFVDGFINTNAARCAMSLGYVTDKTPVFHELQAIGLFHKHIIEIQQRAFSAKKSLEAAKEYRYAEEMESGE